MEEQRHRHHDTRGPMIIRTILIIHLSLIVFGILLNEVRGGDPVSSGDSSEVDPDIAVPVKVFSFETEDDLDFDDAPDDWTRRKGVDFPEFVNAQIDPQVGYNSPRSLRFDLNGGRAAYYSYRIPINRTFSYFVRARVRCSHLKHNCAQLSVSFLNGQSQRVRKEVSEPLTGDLDWKLVEIGPLVPDVKEEKQFVVIGCHILTGNRLDVAGTESPQVWFDDIWIGEAPRLSIKTIPAQGKSTNRLYLSGEAIIIETEIQGVDHRQKHRLIVDLFDDHGAQIASRPYDIEPIPENQPRPAYRWNLKDSSPQGTGSESTREGPGQLPKGTYKVSARLERNGVQHLMSETSFAVLERSSKLNSSNFGWSFPDGLPSATSVSAREMAEIAGESGLGWVKIPLWSSISQQNDPHRHNLTEVMAEMEQHHITTVGMLNDPPAELRRIMGGEKGLSSLFLMPVNEWYPSLEPVLARYSFHVRHWQLGDDLDASFVGLANLGQLMQQIKREFDRIGRDVFLGAHWPYATPIPMTDFGVHGFISLGSSQENRTPNKLYESLRQSRQGDLKRWVSLDLLPPDPKIRRDQRVAYLAKQVIAAKVGGAEVIMLKNPIAERGGVLNLDGSPGELFIPWRVLAHEFNEARVEQSVLSFRNGATSIALRKKDETMLVLWRDNEANEGYKEERAYLGDRVQISDLWGNTMKPQIDPKTGEQIISVGAVPIFIRNCTEPILRWQLAVNFEKKRISSETGAHEEAIIGRNTFPQGVNGTVRLRMPGEWKVEPREWQLQLAQGESFRLPLTLHFPSNGCLGKLESHIEFEITSDRYYKFMLARPYEIGLGDVTLTARQKVHPDGQIEIEQIIENNTDGPNAEVLSFDCVLLIPGEKRQHQKVTKLSKGSDHRIYFLRDLETIKRLQGEYLFLQARQTNGRRVLNYKFRLGDNSQAEDAPDPDEGSASQDSSKSSDPSVLR